MSGDQNKLHTDDAYAKTTPFGQRIGHGLLGLSLASGLLHDMGILRDTALAFRSLDWKFKDAIRIGDKLNARLTVAKTKDLRGSGLVVFDAELFNQDGRTLQQGQWAMLVRGR